jgi:hypothetical protein
MFEDSASDALNAELHEELLTPKLREYERKYFPGVEPISALEVVDLLGNAACFVPDRNVIQIHRSVAPFAKWCRAPMLHELIHHALYKRDGDADWGEGQRFQGERKRLLEAGAGDELF